MSERQGERRSGTRRRTRVVLAAALAVLVLAPGLRLRAHEGHGGIAPVVREIELGSRRYEVGLGVAPADPMVGDSLRIELRAQVVTADGMPGRLARAEQLTLTAGGATLKLVPTTTAGIFAATHVADAEGELLLKLEVRDTAGAKTTTEFPVRVRPGAAARLRPLVAAVMVVAIAGLGLLLWRPLGRRVLAGGPGMRVAGATVALVLLASTLPASRAISSALGGRFTPTREPQAVDWVAEPEEEGGHDDAGHADAATPPAAATPADSAAPGVLDVGSIVARVVVAPDRRADLTVPMTGRVVPVEGLRAAVGQRVKKGQTITTLQPSYIMHDALHLINQRWPILQSTMDSRRRMLESQVRLERLQLALADKAVSTGEVQIAETAAAEARQEYERWSRTLQMHDVQIKDDQAARLPVVSPLDGEIAVANFAQGQLVYEGQPLFTLVDITTVWVEVLVPEHMAPQFRDRTVVFTAAPFQAESFTGRLQRVAPSVDPVARTLSHFYAVSNPRRLLRIGMSLHVATAPATHEDTY